MSTIPPSTPNEASAFPPTMWTQVMKMRDDTNPGEAQRILNRLCQTYWQPLFQYARRVGNPAEQSKDLTQGFFIHLLDKGLFEMADRERGKLRTLLLTAFNRFIRGEFDKATAQKRGGPDGTLSLDAFDDAESNYQLEADDSAAPEFIYDKRCALEVLTAALQRLESDNEKAGKLPQFTSLRQFITVSGNEQSYTIEASKLGVTLGNYKVMVQRFRHQFKEALKGAVRDTLPENATDDELQQEIMEVIRLAYS